MAMSQTTGGEIVRTKLCIPEPLRLGRLWGSDPDGHGLGGPESRPRGAPCTCTMRLWKSGVNGFQGRRIHGGQRSFRHAGVARARPPTHAFLRCASASTSRTMAHVIGDSVEIVIDTGGAVQTYSIVATKAGRRVDVITSRGVVEVVELTRTGNPVRTARFMASRVVALVEHPAPTGSSRSQREPNPDQTRLSLPD